MSWLADPTQRLLERALDGLSRRNALIASNLANIDTPGMRPSSIDFESDLREEIRRTIESASAGQVRSAGAPDDLQPPSSGPSAAVGLRMTDPRHQAGAGVATTADPAATPFDGSLRNDGNTVDLESEMTALVETQLKFSAVSRLVTGRLGMLRDVAGGR